MTFEERFQKSKNSLITDATINQYNRTLFKKFFFWEEDKLKRQAGLSHLDESNYKTLLGYISKLKNVNSWFNNEPWNELTLKKIKKVYNDLEDGNIRNKLGVRFSDRRSYYNKIFKAKPFKLAGIGDKVESALEFFTDKRKSEVEFVNEDTFLDMVSTLTRPHHIALFWLAWDIGENINSLLQLKRKNFKRQINNDTNEAEYRVYLPQGILKRARQTRSEITIYSETVRTLDIVFKVGKEIEVRDVKGQFKRAYEQYGEEDFLFRFGYRQAMKLFDSVIKRVSATCEPHGNKPSWKNLRSGMACNLHLKGWSVEDINMRLGHYPTSRWFDSYVNYLAVNRKSAIKSHYDNSLQDVKNELDQSKQREKLTALRFERLKEEIGNLSGELEELKAGKGFMKVLLKLAKKQKQMSTVLEEVSGKKFDVILSTWGDKRIEIGERTEDGVR